MSDWQGNHPPPAPSLATSLALESAEDFARRLGGIEFEWSITPAIAAIEQRDALVRLAALREARTREEFPPCDMRLNVRDGLWHRTEKDGER